LQTRPAARLQGNEKSLVKRKTFSVVIVLKIAKSALLAWISFGTEKFEGPAKRRIIMTNILVMLISGLCVPYALFFALYDLNGLIIPITMIVFAAAAFQLTPLLHSLNPYAGGLYNLSLWLTFAMTLSWMFSAQ
jgi:adenylate cyclase